MDERFEIEFIDKYAEHLGAFWNRTRGRLLDWRSHYEWPPGASAEGSLNRRTQLEHQIRAELDGQRCLSKGTFDAAIRWGFGADSGCSEQDVRQATGVAFDHLKANRVAKAAWELVKLPGIGISRASKILALSDQREMGIYDSRSANGMSDLVDHTGRPIIVIPPGRVIAGDVRTKDQYCSAFEEYTWVLRHLRMLAQQDSSLAQVFSRVADVEMAYFVRSRTGQIELTVRSSPTPKHLRSIAAHDEENFFWTLGPGRKSKHFWAILDASAVTVLTGTKKTPKTLTLQAINACLAHFRHDPFPLSNSKTAEDRDPKGLGEYFAQNFGSSVFASHFAALWVHQKLLEPSLRDGAWWFRVQKPGS
jgi:hypothetical protein